MGTYLAGQQWVYSQLTSGDTDTAAGSRIHAAEDVPQDVTYPHVEIRPFVDRVIQTMNATTIGYANDFLVVGVKTGNEYESLEAIADAIETDLHRQSGSVSRGEVFYSWIVEPFRNTYRDGDTRYVELGHRVRVRTE